MHSGGSPLISGRGDGNVQVYWRTDWLWAFGGINDMGCTRMYDTACQYMDIMKEGGRHVHTQIHIVL